MLCRNNFTEQGHTWNEKMPMQDTFTDISQGCDGYLERVWLEFYCTLA